MKQCTLLVFASLVICASCATDVLEASPCPRLFVYEDTKTNSDRWYGIITLLSDSNLNGIWIRIMFDKPILQLGNWFGEAVKRGPTEYLVKSPTFNLKAHTPKILRFFVRYNPNSPPPKLIGFKLNGKVLCPEELFTTTTTTTTEFLFTSKDESSGFATEPSEEPTRKPFISHKPETASDSTTDTCGVTTIPSKDTLANQVAQPGEHPWHVALYYTKDITIAYLCGASLISSKHLLTVAHCVVKGTSQRPVSADRLLVYLGKYYLKHWAHEGTQTRYISQVIPHPEYKAAGNRNDIALLKMYKSADFTDVIRPICLWNNKIQDQTGTVVGWGFDESGKIDETLMHVEMTIQDESVCNASVANYTSKYGTDRTFCANFSNDTIKCVGDSGGGMAFRTDEANGSIWYLRGLVTVSVVLQKQLKCGPQQFVVFTDVSKYNEWITETMLV